MRGCCAYGRVVEGGVRVRVRVRVRPITYIAVSGLLSLPPAPLDRRRHPSRC